MKATKKHLAELENAIELLERAQEYINRADGLAFETKSPNGGDYTIRNLELSAYTGHTVVKPTHVTVHSKDGSPLVYITKAIRNLKNTVEKVS